MSYSQLRVPLRTLTGIALVSAFLVATTANSDAAAVSIDTASCANTPIRTSPMDDGDVVRGLTTTKGSTPEPFEGTFVYRAANALGPGKDIMFFELSGSRITKPGDPDRTDAGIWSGMSGSPVYDVNGNLVGAVSYAFSQEPSTLAGITPAVDMVEILKNPSAAAAPTSVKLSAAAQKALKSADISASAAASGLRRIEPTRVTVGRPSPLLKKKLSKKPAFAEALRRSGGTIHSAGSAAGVNSMVPGGNIAVAASYGSTTLASVGTITALCGDRVLAFGHPDLHSGAATQTFHSAATIAIQRDGVLGSSKLADINLSPEGIINQDRISGIAGRIGMFPTTIPVTTTTIFEGSTRMSATRVAMSDLLSTVISEQLYTDYVFAADQDAAGDVLQTTRVQFTRGSGPVQTATRTDRVTHPDDFAESAAMNPAYLVETIQDNQKVSIKSVSITSRLASEYRAYKIKGVDVFKKGKWRKVRRQQTISVKKRKSLKIRVHLRAADTTSNVAPRTKVLTWKRPKKAIGVAKVSLKGHFKTFDDELDEFFDFFSAEGVNSTSASLSRLLDEIGNEPRSDSMTAALEYRNKNRLPRIKQKTRLLDAATRGNFTIKLFLGDAGK